MPNLNYDQLKKIVNESHTITWLEVSRFGKTTSKLAIVKCLIANGFPDEGLAIEERAKKQESKKGSVEYIKKQIEVCLKLEEATKGTVNAKVIDLLDYTVLGNGIIAITLKGLSGKKYWEYVASVVSKVLKFELPEVESDFEPKL